ncbi:MAG: glycoside hydrolase, partial [Spirochaetes bacterium]
ADNILGCSEHKKWRDECVSSSITLVKDTQKLLPVSPETHQRVLLIQSTPVAFFGPPEELHFRDYLEDAGFEVTMMAEDIFPSPDFFDLVIYLVNQTRFFGRGSYFADWQDLHRGLMKSMMRTWDSIPTMMISLSNPYHLFDAPRVKTYINAYSPIESVQKKLVELITGKAAFKGTNPVDPFCGLDDAKL